MKAKRLRIIAAEPMSDKAEASYLLLENKIVYRKDLDKFPRLKNFIIGHELRHQEKPFNYLHHLTIDVIDGWKMLFNRDYYKYREYCSNKYKAELSGYKGNKSFLKLCGVIHLFVMDIYISLLAIIRVPIRIYFRRTK